MLECVVNVSEGRDADLLALLSGAAGPCLRDVHSDTHHNRSVFTLIGSDLEVEDATRSLAKAVVMSIDLTDHEGVHPRIGALDVVPFVALDGWPVAEGALGKAIEARDRFSRWASETLMLPCFSYGPERSLPEVRRGAWSDFVSDHGPPLPHRTAGAAAVGARGLLVAYNLWLATTDIDQARQVARSLRGPALRTLALRVGAALQVSCNLVEPWSLGPMEVFDMVSEELPVSRGELVGLVPRTVLDGIPARRWPELGLARDATIEERLGETTG